MQNVKRYAFSFFGDTQPSGRSTDHILLMSVCNVTCSGAVCIAHIKNVGETTHYAERVSTTHYCLNSITYYFRHVHKPAKGDC